MSKLLDTDVGPQLTGAMHLHALETRDLVVRWGYVWTVIDTALIDDKVGVRLRSRLGGETYIYDDQNVTVDRVIGGRR